MTSVTYCFHTRQPQRVNKTDPVCINVSLSSVCATIFAVEKQ